MKYPSITAILAALLSPLACAGNLAGLWEFADENDLGKATVGNDLVVNGTAPSWAATETYNGFTLDGVITTQAGPANFLKMDPGIAANGGGNFINQYTLVFDVRRPDVTAWRSFFQTAATATANDADYFVRGGSGVLNSLGVAAATYTTFALPADSWHRLVLSVDLSLGSMVTYLTDDAGVAQSHTHSNQSLDGRFSLLTDSLLLFADNDGENQPLTIGTVAFYDMALDVVQVGQLGGPGTPISPLDPPKSLSWTGALGAEWSTGVLASPKNWVLSEDGVTAVDFSDGDIARFDDLATSRLVDISQGDVLPNSVTFSHNTGSFTLSGDDGISGSANLQIGGDGDLRIENANKHSGSTDHDGFGTFTIANPLALQNSTLISILGGGYAFDGITAATLGGLDGTADIKLENTAGDPLVLTLGANGRNVVFDGEFNGSGQIVKIGPGIQILGRASTFAGGTTLAGGSVEMRDISALAGGTITHSGGGLRFSFGEGSSETLPNDITLNSAGHPTFVIRGTNGAAPAGPTTVTLTGKITGGAPGETYRLLDTTTGGNHNNILELRNEDNDFEGIIEMWRGTLGIASDAVLGDPANDIRHYTENINGAIRFDAENITLNPNREIIFPSPANIRPIDTQAFDARIDGPLSGAAVLVKRGSGTLTLAGETSFTGTARIDEGTLAIDGAARLSSLSTIQIAAGAAFDLTAVQADFFLGASQTLAGDGLVVGNLETVGTISPGGPNAIGTLTHQGGVMLDQGLISVEYDSRTGQFDRLVINGGIGVLAGEWGTLRVIDLAAAGGEEQVLPNATKLVLVEYSGEFASVLDVNLEQDVAEGSTVVIGPNEFVLSYDDPALRNDGRRFMTLTVPGEAPAGYAAWAAANAGGQAPELDFDGDGVPNGVEYFMGETGSSFTPNPQVVSDAAARTISWPRDPAATASFAIQTSATMADGDWTTIAPPDASIDLSDPARVVFTLPAGGPRLFVRLLVTVVP